MSLYADYVHEITTDKILEIPEGFATYRYLNEGKSVYIIDIYVIPEARQKGIARLLCNQIIELAKSRGAIELLGTVCLSSKMSTISLKGHLAGGMQLRSVENNTIILRKDI